MVRTFLLFLLIALSFFSTDALACCSGWGKNMYLRVTNNSDSDVWGKWYCFQISEDNRDFWDNVQPDARDVRFTLDDGETQRVFYVYQWDYAGRNASICFLVHHIPPNSSKDFIMWWDNPNAECRGWNGSYCDGTLFVKEGDPLQTLYQVTGFYNVAVTGGTFRTGDNTDRDTASQITDSSSATLNLPPDAKVVKAYLIWGASSDTIDNSVVLNGRIVNADRTHQAVVPFDAEKFYGAVADVTDLVKSISSGTYTLTGLTIRNDELWYSSSTTLGGWSLIVVYTQPEDMTVRRINIYEGFSLLSHNKEDFDLSDILVGSPVESFVTTVTWEGDPDLKGSDKYGNTEHLEVNGHTLSDSTYNPSDNPYNSKSSALERDDTYGVDIDRYDVSSYVSSGQTQMRIHYETAQDMVINPAVIVSTKLASISGHVYEDPNGDGDMADKVPLKGVKVKLFKSNGTFVGDTTTDQYGRYYFAGVQDGDYYVVVDSKTVPPSSGFTKGGTQGQVWAEQTFVSTKDDSPSYARGVCDKDGDGTTAPELVSGSSVCFGGAYGDRSDDASSLSTAEHKIFVHLQDAYTIEDADFGFSFNVVTNTNDRDDDPGNPRTSQGSLRQFILNANGISGANYMRFVPAVKPNSGSWWTVKLNVTADSGNLYALPPVTDSNTVIDGTAYSYQDGKSVRNLNGGSVSVPGTAGTNSYSIPPFDKPELEVDAAGRGSAFTVKASSVTIRKVAVYNVPTNTDKYPACVWVDEGSGVLIEDNYLGVRAGGGQPDSSERAFEGVVVNSHTQVDIKHNLIAYIDGTGIIQDGEGRIEENYIHHTGLLISCGDSITFEFSVGSPYTRTKDQVVVKNNYIEHSSAYGIESWGDRGGYTISNNTITKSGQGNERGELCGNGNLGTTELGGIRLFGTGSLVEYNKIFDNPGSGIVVVAVDSSTPAKDNRITKNSFYSNGGISIDLDQTHTDGVSGSVNPNGDGVSPNDGVKSSNQQNQGLDYPVFTSVTLNGDTLHLEGFVGTPDKKIEETLTIEVYKAEDDGNNNGEVFAGDGKSIPHGEGKSYLGSCSTKSDGTFSCNLSASGLSVGSQITAIAIDGEGNTSEFSANVKVTSSTPSNKITGYVFEDANHDKVMGAGERGIGGVRVELWYYNGSTRTMEAVTQTSQDGYFEFSPSHRSGIYRVVEDYENGGGDSPDSGADPKGYISTTPNVVELSWDGSKNVVVYFGDFHGAKVYGKVFNDIGDGSSQTDFANNGIYDSPEKGIQGVKVKLCKDGNCSEKVAEAVTSGDGSYELWISADNFSDGQTVYLVEEDLSGYTSTGDSVEMKVINDWQKSLKDRNTLCFKMESGKEFKDYNFGDVKVVQIVPPQSCSVSPGGSVMIKHIINVSTPGVIAVMLSSQNGWNYTVYNDSNCDGEPDGGPVSPNSGYYVLNGGNPLRVGNYCVVTKTVVPANTPSGTVEKLGVFVYEDWKNTSGTNGATGSIYDDSNSVSDIIKVGSGMLKLEKWVRNVTVGQDFTKSNVAKPCEVLEYKIDFENVASTPIKFILFSDNIPEGTHFLTSRYNNGSADVEVEVNGEHFYGKVSDLPDTDGVEFDGHTIKINLDKLTGSKYRELLPGTQGWLKFQVQLDCK